jgi:ADP-ribosyl-[dinitrogen reductase] hydrolase
MIKAAIIGLAVGDALVVLVEFRDRSLLKADPVTGMREFGTHHQPRGT